MKRCPVCYVNDFFDGVGTPPPHPQYQYFDRSGDFELCSNHIELIEVFNYNTKRIYFYFVLDPFSLIRPMHYLPHLDPYRYQPSRQ